MLNRHSDTELILLARSTTPVPVDSKTSKEDLIKMIKEALSLEEIESRLGQVKRSKETTVLGGNIFDPGNNGQLLLALLVAISLTGYFGAYVNPTMSFLIVMSYNSLTSVDPTSISSGILIFGIFYLAFTLGICTSLRRMTYRFESSKVGSGTVIFGFVTVGVGIADLSSRPLELPSSLLPPSSSLH